MDHIFAKQNSAASRLSIADESVTCIAPKEDTHNNIMCSFVLKKGVEESRAIERVVKFIDSRGYFF